MFDEEQELLQAIGIKTANLDAMEVFLLSGAIIDDHDLWLLAKHQGTPSEPLDRLEVIKKMSYADRLAFLDKILGACIHDASPGSTNR